MFIRDMETNVMPQPRPEVVKGQSMNNLMRNGPELADRKNSIYGSQGSMDRYTNGSSSSYESVRNLNLSDEKLANIKSPMY